MPRNLSSAQSEIPVTRKLSIGAPIFVVNLSLLLFFFDNTYVNATNVLKKATITGDRDNNSRVWGQIPSRLRPAGV